MYIVDPASDSQARQRWRCVVGTESTASLICTEEKEEAGGLKKSVSGSSALEDEAEDEGEPAGGLDNSASGSSAHEDEAEDEGEPESDADAYENDADEDFVDDAVKPWSSWTTTFQGLLDTARCCSVVTFSEIPATRT